MERIELVVHNKKQYLDLLLLADEQESMIDRYLERGDMFVLRLENEAIAVCVVTNEGSGIYEIKNLAISPSFQRRGYGKKMIDFVAEQYKNRCQTLLVGTGDSPLTLPFYHHCGFVYSHRIANFFIDNYDHPIIEEGVQLKDMIYLKKQLF